MPLSINDISKSFGSKEVLRDFSVELADGERLCLLGPSGSGKTTLLNIIAGLIKPDSGEVICSYDRIAYVFQEVRLLPWLTAQENLTAAAGCSAETARELLAAMELGEECGSYPDALSGGMQQRVNIARALASDSGLILLDEPFKGLDAELKERMIQEVRQRCCQRTMILVTHDRTECDLMQCDTVLEF